MFSQTMAGGRWTGARAFTGALMLAVAGFATSAQAAFVNNYGDYAGTSLSYEDVTESNAGTSALYGTPNISGNTLGFPTVSQQAFIAKADGTTGFSQTRIGTLDFTLSSNSNAPLATLYINEGGDYSFLGGAGKTGAVAASLTVNLYAVAGGSNIGDELATFVQFFSGPALDAGNWSLELTVDLLPFNVTEVFVVINNNLQATTESPATAFIQKKNFTVSTTAVPEPASLALLGLGSLVILAGRGRNKA